MTPTEREYQAARARAAEEKALAKRRFEQLKAAARPSAVARRLGRKASARAGAAVDEVEETLREHPVVVASVIAGAGLVLARRPLGEVIASGLDRSDRA